MPQLTIELSSDELEVLHALAKRKRRSDAQQAAYSLVKYLTRAWKPISIPVEELDVDIPVPEGMEEEAEAVTGVLRRLAESKGRRRGAGDGLAPGEQVGAVEGHRDGAAGGVDQVVVGGPGEAQ